jgi:hypothetical protein
MVMSHINLVNTSCHAKRKFFFIFVILFSLSFTIPVFGAEILFITGARVYDSDIAIQNNLESHGSVTVIRDCEAQYTDALKKDLVVISESVYSRKINTTFRNLPVPIIVSEPWLFNDMGMTGSRYSIDFGRARKQSSIIVNESKHDLTAGLSREVSISYRKSAIGWGVPGPDALKIATLNDDPEKCTVFAYDKGMQMPGLVAPARRVSFYLYRKSASFLTSEGWALFHAAVKWALTPDLIEPVTIKVVSDASWKAQTYYGTPPDNWFVPEYVDKYWTDAYAPFPDPEPDSSTVSITETSFIWYWPSYWEQKPEQDYWGLREAWFRKSFEIPGDPSDFKIQDSSIASRGPVVGFYINGIYIPGDTDIVDTVSPRRIDIGPHLVEGENVIAIHVQEAKHDDPEQRHKGVWFNLALETGPDQNQDSPVKKALLVVGRTPLRYNDRVLKMQLERLGFLVFLADDATVDKADADDMDLILISETVWSKLIGDLFTDVEVPVLCLESYLYDDLNMSGAVRNGDYGNSRRRREIAMTDSDHSLSAGVSDRIKVTTRRRHVGWGLPTKSAIIIASLVDHPERAAIFAYKKGAPMANDHPAPANRTGMFLHGNSASRLTAAGWDLFDAAVKWTIAEQN